MAYAKMLTRDYLEYLGITEVTKDGHIFIGNYEKPQQYDGQYYRVNLYDPAIRMVTPENERTSATGAFTMTVHRIMYAWYNKIVPEGYVVDHQNNIKTDNRIENLQLLSPKENIFKNRVASVAEVKCKMNRPRSFYEERLKNYKLQYEEAKKQGLTYLIHKLRCNIYQVNANLRYWDNHENEYNDYLKQKEEINKKKEQKYEYNGIRLKLKYILVKSKEINKDLWHECCKLQYNYKTHIKEINEMYDRLEKGNK